MPQDKIKIILDLTCEYTGTGKFAFEAAMFLHALFSFGWKAANGGTFSRSEYFPDGPMKNFHDMMYPILSGIQCYGQKTSLLCNPIHFIQHAITLYETDSNGLPICQDEKESFGLFFSCYTQTNTRQTKILNNKILRSPFLLQLPIDDLKKVSRCPNVVSSAIRFVS